MKNSNTKTQSQNSEPKSYDNIGDFVDGIAEVDLNGNYGFIDDEGNEICKPKYDWIDDLKDDSHIYIEVRLNDKYGFIEFVGGIYEICEIKYDWVENFHDGFAKVKLNEKWGFINEQGKEICEIKYDMVYCFVNGLLIVKLNGKYGFISEPGKEICELKFLQGIY